MEYDLTIHPELSCLDDAELITRTQKGETEAFNPIVRRYQQRIYDLIYRQVRHHETTEDLCQDVFLKAWQALPNFKGGASVYSWLYRIAINCSIDFRRKQKRQMVFDGTELPEDVDSVLDRHWTQASPDEILEMEELDHIIREGVRQLPSNQRRVFDLRYEEGLQIKEVASRLEKSEGTIKTHLHHAHRKLRGKLQRYLQTESFESAREA